MCSVIVPTMDIMSAGDSRLENSSGEDGARVAKRKISLSKCGLCGSEEAKYRCPACLTHSCSLLCVKNHKENSGCTGVRNKTAFVALSRFDEMALLNDYRFLEDTGRFADGTSREPLIRAPRANFYARLLTNSARKMNITLRFLPNTFTKSKENSTFFHKKDRQFLWHLKLVFPQSNAEFSRRRVADTKTLEEILTAYIHPTESDPVTRQKLKMYVHAPFDHVRVFMKAEGRKANSARYHELDMQKSLRDNLSYKMLIEYPVLHVVLRDHCQDYPLKGPVSVEPASACRSVARTPRVVDQGKREPTQVSTSTSQGSRAVGGAGVCTGAPETSPEAEPPEKKRAKRDTARDDLEEGEITDSGDEERQQEEEVIGEGHLVRAADAGEVTKEELADSEDDEEEDDDVGEHNDSSRDKCINQHVPASPNARGTSGRSAEVGVTEEEVLEEPEPVHAHRRPDQSDSANTAGRRGME